MQLAFPLTMTWDQIAALPSAADHFGWDETMIDEDDPSTTLMGVIADYSSAFVSSEDLTEYLAAIGYELIELECGVSAALGIRIRSEVALQTAHALFTQISQEYNEPDCPRIEYTRQGHVWSATPTWRLFELGGDDDVDYCGTQPSCLTALLIEEHNT